MTVCPFGSPSENDEERSRSIPSPEQAAQNAPNVPNAPSAQNVNTLEIVSRINAVTKQQVILDTGRTNFQFKNVCNYLDKWNNPARGADDVMVECDKAILEAPHVINTMDDKTTEGLKNLFLFDSEFVQTLLHNVHVLMVGDSIMRGLYKDLLTIHNTDFFTPEKTLGEKVEDSHMGDRQIDVLMLSSDRLFNQAREYCVEDCLIQFIFTTRCIRTDLTSKMMDFLLKSPENGDYPDVIVMNSALWDLTRYKDYHFATLNEMTIEKSIHEEYIDRLSMFLRRLRLLRPITKFLWINFPWPQIPQKDRGFLAKADVQGDKKYYSCLVMEGQFRAAQVVRNAGYDVLDLGFYLRNHALQVFRKPDGVHWDRVGTRVMTQLLLGHLAKMFNVDVKPEPDISRKIHGMTTKFTHDRLWRAAANLLQTMDTTTNIGGKRHGNWVERLQMEIRAKVIDSEDINELLPLMRDMIRIGRACLALQHRFDTRLCDNITVKHSHLHNCEEYFKKFFQKVYIERHNGIKYQHLVMDKSLKARPDLFLRESRRLEMSTSQLYEPLDESDIIDYSGYSNQHKRKQSPDKLEDNASVAKRLRVTINQPDVYLRAEAFSPTFSPTFSPQSSPSQTYYSNPCTSLYEPPSRVNRAPTPPFSSVPHASSVALQNTPDDPTGLLRVSLDTSPVKHLTPNNVPNLQIFSGPNNERQVFMRNPHNPPS